MEEQIQSIRDLDAEEIDLSIKSTSCTQNLKDLDAEKVDISTKSKATQVIFSSSIFSSSSSASSYTSLPLFYYSEYSFILSK